MRESPFDYERGQFVSTNFAFNKVAARSINNTVVSKEALRTTNGNRRHRLLTARSHGQRSTI
jgi:hypothetical protein